MSRRPVLSAFPQPNHNHGSCEAALLDRAMALFQAKGMKLTDLRRRVLEEIAASHQALGAYDILERLATKGPRLAPISVYRAIDALHAAGLVHRLESRNAFFACHARHEPERGQVVLVCDQCRCVAEIAGEQVFAALRTVCDTSEFEVRQTVTEVAGKCATCRIGS